MRTRAAKGRHPVADPVVTTTKQGARAVMVSFGIMAATALLQAAVSFASGSMGLWADTLHNLADAATALPLWIAFRLGRRKPDRRFSYGYGRVEDLAGVVIVATVVAGAIAAGAEAIRRFAEPAPVGHLGAVALASVAGFVGNEAVAAYRIRAGNAIGSAALVADGQHARADGLTSLSVLLGAGGVALGYPAADPAVGLLISVLLLRIGWRTGREIFLRLLDGADPKISDAIVEEARGVAGVLDVSDIRVRWAGHRLYAEVSVTVDGGKPVAEGHAIAADVRHRLLHRLPELSDATVHVDPPDASGAARHVTGAHGHDDFSEHAH